jgi:predicted DsbA family dithiol-disulfide isomerase
VTPLPFELHPEIPLEGRSLNPSRYGRFVEMTAEAGLPFAAPERVPNTRRALATAEFVRRSSPFEVFDALDRSLFAAYWVEGRDIGSADVLDSLVATAGADAAAVRAAVEAGEMEAELDQSRDAALDVGVTGTPAWLIDGRLLIPGYQPVELFQRVLSRLID